MLISSPCPTCDARCDNASCCRRCKTDLTWLRQVEQSAEVRLQQCLRALAARQIAEAQYYAERAVALYNTEQTRRVLRLTLWLMEVLRPCDAVEALSQE